MARDLVNVLRSPPERAERFLSRLFEKVPSVLTIYDGLRVIARAMHRLSPLAIQRWMERLEADSWSGREQAFGELLVLFATRKDATPWARQQLASATSDFEASPSRRSRIVGIALAAAAIWNEPDRRQAATDLLGTVIPFASGAVAKAVMRIFRSQALQWDAATQRMLKALRDSPQVMVDGGPWKLVEQLRDLLPIGAPLVAEMVTALVGHRTPGQPATVIGPADVLIEISMILQRLGDPLQPNDPLRAQGLALFEQLLDSDVHEAHQALETLDRRGSGSPPRPRQLPRRKHWS
jgi:hypothetical protein